MTSVKGVVGKVARAAAGAGRVIGKCSALAANRFGGQKQRPLILLDDVFPLLLSSFRVAEYNAYFQHWPDAVAYSTGETYGLAGTVRKFSQTVNEYEARFPQYKGRVRRYRAYTPLAANLIYLVFLNNAAHFLEAIQTARAAFVFTLYPGGGFALDDPLSDAKLAQVCRSPFCRAVIVTQKVTQEYLRDKQLLDEAQISFQFGGVLPADRLALGEETLQAYQRNKPVLDICFVANKYMAQGVDKGYDVFVEVARKLIGDYPDVNFHVVGTFDATDIDVSGLAHRIQFYGTQPTEFFPSFYATMDIILSPNAAFTLRPGAFDGFPTGACVEAGLCGVAVFCTDPLQQNLMFSDRRDIILITRSADEICNNIGAYHNDPAELWRLRLDGQRTFKRIFDLKAQMEPRIKLLERQMIAEHMA